LHIFFIFVSEIQDGHHHRCEFKSHSWRGVFYSIQHYMWSSLSVTCDRSLAFSRYFGFLHNSKMDEKLLFGNLIEPNHKWIIIVNFAYIFYICIRNSRWPPPQNIFQDTNKWKICNFSSQDEHQSSGPRPLKLLWWHPSWTSD
jgi:hypothetical protein